MKREAGSRASVRFWLMVLAPIEFIVMIFVGAVLHLFQATFIYFAALRSLLMRAAALFALRFTKGDVFTSGSGKNPTLPLSEPSPPGAIGQGRFSSWLN